MKGEVFELVVRRVVELVDEGRTAAEIRNRIPGSFFDEKLLTHIDRTFRAQAATLLNAMVEQAINALCPY